jgi:hypothetical protein
MPIVVHAGAAAAGGPALLASWGAGTWALAIAGGLLAVVLLLPAIAGLLLPERYRAAAEVRLDAAPEEVWARLLAPEEHPLSRGACRRVERLPPVGGLPSWREHLGPTSLVVDAVEAEPPLRLVLEATDEVVPLDLRVEVELHADGAGTRVLGRSETRVRRGTWHVPYLRVVLASGGARRALRAYLEGLASTVR